MKANRKEQHTLGTCQVCHQNKPMTQLLPARVVHGSVLDLICTDHPDWSQDAYICYSCLNQYRTDYVRQLMEKDLGELDELEQEVVKSLHDNALLSENLNEEYEKTLTFGDRIADKVASSTSCPPAAPEAASPAFWPCSWCCSSPPASVTAPRSG